MTLLDRINLADAVDTAIARVQREMACIARAADSNDWHALRVQYDALVAEKRRIGQGA